MPSKRPEEIVQYIAIKLSEARVAKGLSINKLAWMSNVSPKGITFIEQGKNSPTLKNVIRLATALEVNLPKLFQEADEAVMPIE